MNDADTLTLNRLQGNQLCPQRRLSALAYIPFAPPIGSFKTLENTPSTIQKINSIIFQVKVQKVLYNSYLKGCLTNQALGLQHNNQRT